MTDRVQITPLPPDTTLVNGEVAIGAHNADPDAHPAITGELDQKLDLVAGGTVTGDVELLGETVVAPPAADDQAAQFSTVKAATGILADLATAGLTSGSGLISAAGSGGADMLFIGDSITEGAGSTIDANLSSRWQQLVVNAVRGRAGVTGGRGYVPAVYGAVGWDDPSPTIANDATAATIYGLGRREVIIGAGGVPGTVSLEVTGTSVDVVYARTTAGGSFTISRDSTVVATVSAAPAPYASGGFTERVTLPDGDPHTITVTHASGADVHIEGFMIYDGDESSGVRLWDAAHSGYGVQNFWANQTWQFSLQAAKPDIVFIALGTNDFRVNMAASEYETKLGDVVDRIQAQTFPGGGLIVGTVSPIVLVHLSIPRDGTYTGSWDDYGAAVRAVAAARTNVHVVDLSNNLPASLFPDDLHPNDLGHSIIASGATLGAGSASSASAAAGWITPTLINGWVNYDTASFHPASYRIDGNEIELRGAIKSGTIGQPAFTMGSTGLTKRLLMACGGVAGGERLDIAVSGNVTPTTGANTLIGLDGVRFTIS